MKLLIAAGPMATIDRLKTMLEEFSRMESLVYTKEGETPVRCLEISHPDLTKLDRQVAGNESLDWPVTRPQKDPSLRVAVMTDLASTPDPANWPAASADVTFDHSNEFDFLIAHIHRLAETMEALHKASIMDPV